MFMAWDQRDGEGGRNGRGVHLAVLVTLFGFSPHHFLKLLYHRPRFPRRLFGNIRQQQSQFDSLNVLAALISRGTDEFNGGDC